MKTSMNNRPPYLAKLVLKAIVAEAQQDEVLGDMTEEYNAIERTEGNTAAKRWYRLQVFFSIGDFLYQKVQTRAPYLLAVTLSFCALASWVMTKGLNEIWLLYIAENGLGYPFSWQTKAIGSGLWTYTSALVCGLAITLLVHKARYIAFAINAGTTLSYLLLFEFGISFLNGFSLWLIASACAAAGFATSIALVNRATGKLREAK